jgi:hypothetical protein
MNFLIKISTIGLMMISLSCNSTKSATEDKSNITETTETTKAMESKLINEGYLVGTIKYIKDNKCSYIIIDEKTGAKFDPINLDDDKFKAYKKDATTVYYKYRGLRMMNRCNEAQPISIIDIKSKK